ncbi:hypothetical protein FBEOM_2292 [Fusarium beomiforme]|uniref:Uncharacterized protein n=1 Tax=Fusarium beomiforme TaxID=44412 RepID=A0A9P5E1Y6_9HYPO|nr:hypothetical protein FBEOM_2292 [Fusarium beomiforme]
MFQSLKKFICCCLKREKSNQDTGLELLPKPKTFPRFKELPGEIQNLIWGFAVGTGDPRAYFVAVRRDTWCRLSLKQVRPSNLGHYPLPPNGDYDLKLVCRSAYEGITHNWAAYKPEVPVRMELNEFLELGNRVITDNSLEIDAACDLLIIEQWRFFDFYPNGFRGIVHFPIPRWNEPGYNGLEGFQYVAFPVDANPTVNYRPEYLPHVKAIFPNVRTVYLYIEPAMLFPLHGHRTVPMKFFAVDSVEGEEPPLAFKARGRIFYEVCPEKLRSANVPAAHHVRGSQMQRYANDTVPIKFMSWHWAHVASY